MTIGFDGATKLITLSAGTTTLNVRDLWSRWVDWQAISDNSKYLPAFDTVGGNVVDAVAGTSIPIYCFMQNGWAIKPQEASHTLNVTAGVLLVDGGGDPFVDPDGSFVVRINYSQPVQAITVNTASEVASGVWEHVVESTYTAEQIMRLMGAVLAGTVSGAGTGTETFKGLDTSTNRIVATVDSSGNRLSITTNGS